MNSLAGALLVAALALHGAADAQPDEIGAAAYELPVERYGHFAAGRPHEYARLTARTAGGDTLSLTLGAEEVFEDVRPRLIRLAPDAPRQVLTIVSHRATGARLAVFGVVNGRLALLAQSDAIGTPMRWLNPVGVADLDGDGLAEIAAVVTPHLGGSIARLAPRRQLAGRSGLAAWILEPRVRIGRTRLSTVLPGAGRTSWWYRTRRGASCESLRCRAIAWSRAHAANCRRR